LSFNKAIKLILSIRERHTNEFIERVYIAGTALMDGEKRKELIEDLRGENELDYIQETNFHALDNLKSQMK
jgi:hypothetical protein